MKFIEAESLNIETYQKNLDEIGGYSFFHTKKILDYYQKSSNCKNLSFFCYEQQELIGFVALAVNNIKNKINFSFGSTPCHLPIIKNTIKGRTRKKYLKEILIEIFNKLKKYKFDNIDFFYHPVSFKLYRQDIDYKNAFQILNFFDVDVVTINMNLVDLKEDQNLLESRLYPKLRQEFKKQKYNDLSFNVINNKNCNTETINKYFDSYKKFHFLSAGKVTRPSSSWEAMREDLIDGRSSLFVIKKMKECLSFLLCFEHKKFSIGASQTNTKNLELLKNYMLRHYLEYKTINYYKLNEFVYYQIGHTYYFDKSFKSFEEKHKRIGISKLKFGADLFPVHYFRFSNKNKSVFDKNYKYVVENEF